MMNKLEEFKKNISTKRVAIIGAGVSNLPLISYLKKLGCDIVQGYLYDKPIPAAQFKEKYIDNVPISTGRKRLIFK